MIKLAFYSLFRRPLRQFLLFLLIALSAAVPVFLLQVTDGLYEGINHSVRPFPILVGAKGSSYQLVLNTVFLRDRPIGNIPYTEMDKLEDSGKVQAVYPLAFGDNYRASVSSERMRPFSPTSRTRPARHGFPSRKARASGKKRPLSSEARQYALQDSRSAIHSILSTALPTRERSTTTHSRW